jgi:hypothetical protein
LKNTKKIKISKPSEHREAFFVYTLKIDDDMKRALRDSLTHRRMTKMVNWSEAEIPEGNSGI